MTTERLREKLRPIAIKSLCAIGLLVQSCQLQADSELPKLYPGQHCNTELSGPIIKISDNPSVSVLSSSLEFQYANHRYTFCHTLSNDKEQTLVFEIEEIGLPNLLAKLDSHIDAPSAARFIKEQRKKGENQTNPIFATELFPSLRPTAPLASEVLTQDHEILYSLADSGFSASEFLRKSYPQASKYASIIENFAIKFSISQKLLLALLEENSHLSSPVLSENDMRTILSDTVSDVLSAYYQYADNPNIRPSFVSEGILVYTASDTDTAATFALRSHIGKYNKDPNEREVVFARLKSVYRNLDFGNPVFPPIEPILLDLSYPFAGTWNYTGGPHASYGNDHAATHGALDFAPSGEDLTCGRDSNSAVLAIADGPVVFSEGGHVIQDISLAGIPADGDPTTGYRALYLHTRSRDATRANTILKTGDRVGAPSCEGGIADGNHLHFTLALNGRYLNTEFLSFEGDTFQTGKDAYAGALIKDGVSQKPGAVGGNDKLLGLSPVESNTVATGR